MAAKIAAVQNLETSSAALDMTNFATWVDSANGSAQLLAGAGPNRNAPARACSDSRLLVLGPVVTRDGAIPLAGHAYPDNRPDVSVFTGTLSRTAGSRPPSDHQDQMSTRGRV